MSAEAFFNAVPDAGWRERAACRGMDPAQFVPGGGRVERVVARAKAVCATCEVREPCLAEAMGSGVVGVWGGTTEAERDRLRGHKVPRRPDPLPIRHGTSGGALQHYRRGERPCPECRRAANEAEAMRVARRRAGGSDEH